MMQDITLDEHLSTLFGDSRAEWLGKRIFDLFAKPAYFPELEQRRPCVLIGGRGTGKTMVLRGLSYEGRHALSNSSSPSDWAYYGLYYKVNTNRVTAFAGPEVSEGRWTQLFAHYVNLLLCEKISNFMMWYEESVGSSTALSADQFRVVCESLHIKHVDSFAALSSQIKMSLVQFESLINNIGDSEEIRLTTQGVPIDVLCEMVGGLPGFEHKQFYFLIDEYESLSPLQQRVFNTLIKNCGERYSFKIGVRELGWRVHETLNPADILESPADYARIDIGERLDGERFSEFALAVCNNRLSQLPTSFSAPESITSLFPGISDDDEATYWDVESLVSETKSQLLESFPDDAPLIEGMEPLRLYFLTFWARGKKANARRCLQRLSRKPSTLADTLRELQALTALYPSCRTAGRPDSEALRRVEDLRTARGRQYPIPTSACLSGTCPASPRGRGAQPREQPFSRDADPSSEKRGTRTT